jgi:hypothetical protein
MRTQVFSGLLTLEDPARMICNLSSAIPRYSGHGHEFARKLWPLTDRRRSRRRGKDANFEVWVGMRVVV